MDNIHSGLWSKQKAEVYYLLNGRDRLFDDGVRKQKIEKCHDELLE